MATVRQETKHSMLRRCNGWDYRRPCIYLVTLTLADRRSGALGRLVVENPDCREPEVVKVRIELSKLGAGILGLWKRMGEFAPQVKPLFGQVMPDHFHGILQVSAPMSKPLGSVIGGFKGGCTALFRELSLAAHDKPCPVLVAKAPSSRPVLEAKASSSRSVLGAKAPSLFSPGFNDKILFRAGELDAWFSYLADNPRRLAVKRLFPDFFKVLRDVTIDLGFPARFNAIGNTFLLGEPRIVQVQCSRSLVPGSSAFAGKCESLLADAERGAVLVSPCVSPGEREIAKRAFEAGAKVIAIKNKGFAPIYKPGGKLFDKCANGRLLLLAPAAWPYTPAEKSMTRFDACAMNRIAQLIAKDGAATISYRGMTPANIDSLVKEACA